MKYECNSCKVIKPYRDVEGKKTCDEKYICNECKTNTSESQPIILKVIK